MIYVLRVTTGQEKIIGQMLEKKIKAQDLDVYSIFVPGNVKGYLFVEAKDDNTVANLAHNTRHVKGVLKQKVSLEEIRKMVKEEKPTTVKIEVGDIVEIKSGAFKGDKAKVTSIDEAKGELVVEFVDMAVPIPTKIKKKIVKIYKKAEK